MNRIILADSRDKEDILALYCSMRNGPADWDEHYPSMETIDFDLSRNALYAMKNAEGEILAVISIDEDEEVRKLDCWSSELQPSAEIARLCVRSDMQGQGIAVQMIEYIMDVLRARQMKSIHLLVRPGHTHAVHIYERLGFVETGSCMLFDKTFQCMEKQLSE